MSSSRDQHRKDETIMTSVAESIGSALGSIVSHASDVSEALSPSHLSHAARREGKKLVRKSETLARRIQKKTSTSLRRNKLAMSTRRAVRGTVSKAKRTRPVASKKKVARRGRKKK